MKHIQFLSNKISSIFLFMLLFQPLFSQNLLLNSSFEDSLTHWDSWINDTTLEYDAQFSTSSTAYSGNKALKVVVSSVKNDYWAFRDHNIRLGQGGFQVNDADVLSLSFFAKASYKGKRLQAGIADTSQEVNSFWKLADYDMSNFDLTTNWQFYEIKFLAPDTTNNIRFLLRFGSDTGTFYIDSITLKVVDNIADENDWYQQAQARIDTLRKGDLTLRIIDENSDTCKNCQLTVALLRHNFQWGTALRDVSTASWNNSQNVWERTITDQYFNTIVNESAFKWPQMEPTQNNVGYNTVNNYVNWKEQQNIQMRGHCLIWTKEMYLPSWWQKGLLSNENAYKALETRCKRELAYYKGRIADYDVVNEAVHFPYVEEWLGDSVYTKMFRWSHETDSQAVLYMNEWWNYDKWDNWRIRKWIEKRIAEGAPIHGIGFQSHLDNERVDWREYKFKIDYLAELGLKLKITEFDMHYDQIGFTRVEMGEDYGKMMRLAFSYPQMEGFLIWGLKDGWRDNAAIFNDDNTPRPAADTMFKLINEVWVTNETGITDAEGRLSFNGYYGDYQVIVEKDGKTDTLFINLNEKQKTLTIEAGLSTENNLLASFSPMIYPNPVHEEIHIQLSPSINDKSRIMIFTTNGNRVFDYSYPISSSTVIIPVDYLPTGIYFITVQQGSSVITKKIVKK